MLDIEPKTYLYMLRQLVFITSVFQLLTKHTFAEKMTFKALNYGYLGDISHRRQGSSSLFSPAPSAVVVTLFVLSSRASEIHATEKTLVSGNWQLNVNITQSLLQSHTLLHYSI